MFRTGSQPNTRRIADWRSGSVGMELSDGAVALSFEDWERLSQVPSFGRLLGESPFEAGDLPARHDGLRETEFWAVYLVDTNVLTTGARRKSSLCLT
jgi:hypothetical protein